MTDEEKNEHTETLATTPFLSSQMWHVQNLFVQTTLLSTFYKRRHTITVCVYWHISIGTPVTNCTTLRSSAPLKSRQILKAMATGHVLSEKKGSKSAKYIYSPSCPLLQYIKTNKSSKICLCVCFLQYVRVRKCKMCGLQGGLLQVTVLHHTVQVCTRK